MLNYSQMHQISNLFVIIYMHEEFLVLAIKTSYPKIPAQLIVKQSARTSTISKMLTQLLTAYMLNNLKNLPQGILKHMIISAILSLANPPNPRNERTRRPNCIYGTVRSSWKPKARPVIIVYLSFLNITFRCLHIQEMHL